MMVTTTTMMVSSIGEPSNTNSAVGSNEDADRCLSEMTENSLMISNTQDVTRFHNNALINTNLGGLYSNGLSNMTTIDEDSATNDSVSNDAMAGGPLGASSSLAMPLTDVVADVGLLAVSFPDSWNGWESKRRSESMGHHETNWKQHHQKQLHNLKRIRRKSVNVKRVKIPSLGNFRRRRLRLERSIGMHLRENQGCLPSALPLSTQDSECEIVPFQSSKSLRRRQRRRVVRFRDEENVVATVEWKREQMGVCFGRGLSTAAGTETPFLEAHLERKQSQRTLLDLQVGMKCMGL